MASESSTICFRVPVEERNLLEAVAHYSDLSLSAFARSNLMAAARSIILEVGPEAIMEKDKQFEQQRASQATDRLRHRLQGLGRLK